jgi:hypothetical protein
MSNSSSSRSDRATRALATRQDDSQWSAFVYWTLMATIYAEERFIDRNKTAEMPVVRLFGPGFVQMFRDAISPFGNYGEIYNLTVKESIPRADRNRLNVIPYGPQQFPFLFP